MTECELLKLAEMPLSIRELELLELEQIEILTRQDNDPRRDRAKVILRMAAEIRRARGCADAEATMSEEEMGTEIAILRGAS